MDFAAIQEPNEIRNWMTFLREKTFAGGEGNIDWDLSVVWAGNQLPEYFWDEWKSGLKEKSF